MPPPPPRLVNDSATYRDLLLFEERLKTTAVSLQRRKSKYQLFLFQLLLLIAFFLTEVILPPQSSILAIPVKFILQRTLPNIYGPNTQLTLHPYFASGLLLVSVTTLVLFFASGMYSEKIAYANKYVPHANKALRSFNMYLNVRKPPLLWSPFSFFFPRPETTTSTVFISKRSTNPVPISGIPPASNPRGELIFSSRIDKTFRESYERYRSAFERKREERERLQGSWSSKLLFWKKPPPITHVRTVSVTSTAKGKNSRSGTPMRTRERSKSPMSLPVS